MKPSPFHGPITESFLQEVREYRLHFLCEDCTHFDPSTESCIHGYPNEPHRRGYFDDEAVGKTLVFCRDFDLT